MHATTFRMCWLISSVNASRMKHSLATSMLADTNFGQHWYLNVQKYRLSGTMHSKVAMKALTRAKLLCYQREVRVICAHVCQCMQTCMHGGGAGASWLRVQSALEKRGSPQHVTE